MEVAWKNGKVFAGNITNRNWKLPWEVRWRQESASQQTEDWYARQEKDQLWRGFSSCLEMLYCILLCFFLRGFGPRLGILRIAIHWNGTDVQNFYWFKQVLMHVTTSGSRGNNDNTVLIFFPISYLNLCYLKHPCFSVEINRLSLSFFSS